MAFIGVSEGFTLYGVEGFQGETQVRSVWREQCPNVNDWSEFDQASDNWDNQLVASSDWEQIKTDKGQIIRCD